MMTQTVHYSEATPLLPGLSVTSWKIEIYPICPQCGSAGVLAGADGGGVSIICNGCNFTSVHKGMDGNALVKAILTRAAK